MSRILQAYFPPSLRFFRKNFLAKYDLLEYRDPYQPALFFGAFESSELIDKHKDWKLILPCLPNDYPVLKKHDKILLICSDNYDAHIFPHDVIRKSITPEIKDYSIFKPKPLGDKIYIYTGFKNGWNLCKDEILSEIQNRIDYEIIRTHHKDAKEFYDIEYLKSNYYDKCFLNLNLSNGNGLSTVIEMGLMGMKTIFKYKYFRNIQRLEFPNFIPYENVEDIVNIINEESKKIGTIQPPINAHNVQGDEWLYLDYWLK